MVVPNHEACGANEGSERNDDLVGFEGRGEKWAAGADIIVRGKGGKWEGRKGRGRWRRKAIQSKSITKTLELLEVHNEAFKHSKSTPSECVFSDTSYNPSPPNASNRQPTSYPISCQPY